jgi:signal transduction histidine kinase
MGYRMRRAATSRVDPHARRLLAGLLGINQLVRAGVPLDALLQAILEAALQAVPGVQRGSLLVREGRHLVYRAAVGYNLEQLRRVSFPADDLEQWTRSERGVLQVTDFIAWDEQHLAAEDIAILRQYGGVEEIRCSLVAPILVDGQFYGNLVLDNVRSARLFPAIAESLVQAFAEQAGAIIGQALMVERLQHANQRIAEAERLAALGQLVAGVMHEINNPLLAVLGYAELLGDEPLSPEGREAIGQIKSGAQRVRTIVGDLLAFARQQHVDDQDIDLNLQVRQTLALMQPRLDQAGIAVSLDLPASLPLTWGSPGQINQVLLNLIANSYDALRAPGLEPAPVLTLRTWSERTPDGSLEVCLSIHDTGPGISPALASRIFEPFFTTKPLGEGTGLGLSICYGIISRHGGRIWPLLEGEPGATFQLALPARGADQQL